MFRPEIRPGMKQTDELSGIGIETGYVRAFVAIAVRASECEVTGNSLSPVLRRDDMVDLEGQRQCNALIALTFPRNHSGDVHRRKAKRQK